MTLQGAVGLHGNIAGWPEITLRAFLRRIERAGEIHLPLLGVGLHEGVRRRAESDGRPAASEDLSGYKVVQEGDIIMNRLGKPHGSVGVSPWKGITSPAYWVMEIDRKLAQPAFVHHLLRSRHLVREYERLGKYMPPNQFDISWEEFRSIEVPLPPLEEQRRIAKYLDVANSWIDQSVTAISRRIELLESKRRALLGLTFSNPESRSIRLGYYLDLVTSGPRGWGEYASAQGRIFFRSANLRRAEIEPNLDALTLVEPPLSAAAESMRSRVHAGDVLVGITGANAGWISLADHRISNANVSQHVCLIRPGRSIEGQWLAYALSSPQIQELLLGSQYGGTKTQLSLDNIRNLVIPLPSLEKQREIAMSVSSGLSAISSEIATRTGQISLLAERRQVLITAAVTGQIDVTTAHVPFEVDGVKP